MAKKVKVFKKKVLKLERVKYYKILIDATYNNTRISLVDNGNIVRSISCGHLKFKGTQKSTPYAAEKTTAQFMDEVYSAQGRKFNIEVKGSGLGRPSAIRVIQDYMNRFKDRDTAITIDTITDVTPQRHNTQVK